MLCENEQMNATRRVHLPNFRQRRRQFGARAACQRGLLTSEAGTRSNENGQARAEGLVAPLPAGSRMSSEYQLDEPITLTERHALFRATQTTTGRAVVLKRARRDYPLPDDVLRLELERHLLDELRGRGVIELLDFQREAGSPVLVLEDFGARSLADVPPPLELPDFFAVAQGLVEALSRVHAANVIHKDIKPSNVLWNRSTGVVKLIDFQLAAELSQEHRGLGSSESLAGSLPYLSPEQTGRMNRALDYRSDYYSLGVTFFELLTGQLPFAATDVMGWVHCHVSRRPPLASDLHPSVPKALALLVAKLMKKEPSQRYQSSRGLLADLRRLRAAVEAGRGDDDLELGAHDVSERFSVSHRLVGRSAEIEALLAAFERASAGEARLLGVTGHAGIGKSSLIGEVHRPIVGKGGYFAAGKFDQLERSVPYAALLDALRELIHQLLAESEPRIVACRERIVAEVGSGLSLIVEVLPELTRIVGPQPASELVDARASQSRFRNAFARLVRALARADAPLVIFLDDMQWTDASTPELLVEIVARADLKHLLLIVALRDHEPHARHLAGLALRELRSISPGVVDELPLAPLAPEALGELVANSLQTTPERCASLTQIVAEKSHGNPFFAGELLTTLQRRGALRLDAELGEWTWDIGAVRAARVTDNVVDLMVQRLAVLPARSLAALRLAACLGSTFSLSALAALLEDDPSAVAEALWEPTRDGAITPLDERYRYMRWASEGSEATNARFRFQHDRVQEAAYSLIPEPERAATHLRIGRLLAQQGQGQGLAAQELFAVCNHMNQGRALLHELAEREQLMRLNQQAGATASAATAFGVAVRYLDAAANCLTAGEWAERRAARFELFSARVTAVLMAGELERAATLCDELFELTTNDAQRGQVFLLKCSVSLYQANLVAAVEAVRQGSRLFGVELPSEPEAIDAGIGAGIGRMQAHLARVPVDQLPDLPELTDPGLRVAVELLFNVIPAAIMISPPLFVLAELLMFDLALTHGLTAVCAKNLVDCGMIQGQFIGDYATAYRLGKAAFRVMDRFGARTLGTSVHFVFAGFVSSWGAPHEEALASCQIGKKLSIESGDNLHLAYHNVLYPRLLLLMGRSLAECAAECREAMALVTRLGATVQALGVRLCQRAIERLTDAAATPDEAARADAALESDIVASGNHQWGFQGGEAMLFASVLLGDWDAALGWSRLARRHELAGSTYVAVPEFHLLECLLTARRRWASASAEARAALLSECRERREKLRGWAVGCAENHEHSFALADAEVARLEGEPMAAVLARYERAARCAGQRFIHMQALALELQSQYLRDNGSESLADGSLERAVALYAHWGAAAKVKRLAAQLPRLFSGSAAEAPHAAPLEWPRQTALRGLVGNTIGLSHLDLESVLEATQAISGEVKAERLFALLMHTMAKNAGAERGCLVLPGDGPDVGLVCARTESGIGGSCTPAAPDEREHRVCASVLRYVARTRSELIIDDASTHPRFSREPYVEAFGVKSVLCLPVLQRGNLSALLYLENNATTHAFTADRVRALRVLAGQAAISIANAQLYAMLEQRVEERTRALSAKTRKVEAMLHGIHQGVFTLDADLRVQPEYSEHLPLLVGERDIVGRSVDALLFDGTSLSAAERSRNDSALLVAFGAPTSIAEVNASHLIKEFKRPGPDGSERAFEVDWNWIVGETQRVESVLVTLRDVTLVRGLAKRIAEAEREATLIARVVDAGFAKFLAFCAETRQKLAQAADLLSSSAALGPIAEQTVFRSLHTIKGNAGVLGLDAIVRAAHDAEDLCRPRDGEALEAQGRAAALGAVRALEQLVAEHEALATRKLGGSQPGGEPWHAEALAAIEARLAQAPETPLAGELRAIIDDSSSVPLRRLFEGAAQNLPALARQLGKAEPILDCEEDGSRLATSWAPVLADTLVHVLRNSLDHGIEPADERLAAGKPARGRVFLRVDRREHVVRLRLGDDGRGLPLDRLREKAGGQPCSDDELAELMFAFGVSTAHRVSTISGRGVGLDAVRSELRRRGGDAWAEFSGPAHDGHRPFELVIALPAQAARVPARGASARAFGLAESSAGG